MGTKNKPGKFDCYSKLEPDEPHFVIMGRDPSASLLISLWAVIRECTEGESGKTEEAHECAEACYDYARKRGKNAEMEAVQAAFDKYLVDANR